MKKLQKLYGVAAVLIIVLGMVGCNLMDRDVNRPTSPVDSAAVTPGGAGQLANFYVTAGTSDFYGVYVANTSFLVNIPKPGMFLLTYYTKAGFGISDQTLENLRTKGVPENVLAGLRLLKDQKFATETEFLLAVTKQIGNDQIGTYKDLIWRYAYASIGGPYVIVAQVKKNSVLAIGLMSGDRLMDAAIDEGDATALATTTPDAQNYGSVIVFFRPGFLGHWRDYFVLNPLILQTSLVSNGAIVISVNVIELQIIPTTISVSPHIQHSTKPKTKK